MDISFLHMWLVCLSDNEFQRKNCNNKEYTKTGYFYNIGNFFLKSDTWKTEKVLIAAKTELAKDWKHKDPFLVSEWVHVIAFCFKCKICTGGGGGGVLRHLHSVSRNFLTVQI